MVADSLSVQVGRDLGAAVTVQPERGDSFVEVERLFISIKSNEGVSRLRIGCLC